MEPSVIAIHIQAGVVLVALCFIVGNPRTEIDHWIRVPGLFLMALPALTTMLGEELVGEKDVYGQVRIPGRQGVVWALAPSAVFYPALYYFLF